MDLEQLYRFFYPKLTAYATVFLPPDEAHDAVQEVFLDLLTKQRKSFDATTMNAFLYRAVQNKCIDATRRKAVRNNYASDLSKQLMRKEIESLASSHNEVEEWLESKELQEHLDAAIEKLPDKGREVFKLYFDHQKQAKEIAEALGVALSTVKNHIYLSFKSLREELKIFR